MTIRGEDSLIELLNEVLTAELTAINQYFLHAKMLENWGYERLAQQFREESIDEMKHADELIERILYLEGVPNLQRLGNGTVGETVPEKLQLALDRRDRGDRAPQRGIEVHARGGDNGTRDLLEEILDGEEEHVDWLETQLELISQVGDAALPRAADPRLTPPSAVITPTSIPGSGRTRHARRPGRGVRRRRRSAPDLGNHRGALITAAVDRCVDHSPDDTPRDHVGRRREVRRRGADDEGAPFALTFHTDGDLALAQQYLDVLRNATSHVTCFIVGKWLDANPTWATQAHRAGHELANHTYNHLTFDQLHHADDRRDRALPRPARAPHRRPGRYLRPSGTNDGTITPPRPCSGPRGAAGYGTVLGFDVDPLDYTDPAAAVTQRTLAAVPRPVRSSACTSTIRGLSPPSRGS